MAQASATPVLKTARAVLDLTPEEVRSSRPAAQLRGVVTLHSQTPPWFYVQDDTAGVQVVPRDSSLKLKPGDRVDVSGGVFLGMFKPGLWQAEVKITGTAPLPDVIHTQVTAILSGTNFGQTVELEGCLRDHVHLGKMMFLRVAADSVTFRAAVLQADGFNLPAAWRDARVRVRGVVWTDNDRRSFTIHASSPADLQVLAEGVDDLGRIPMATVSDLFARGVRSDARVRMNATVAMTTARSLLLRDDTGAMTAMEQEGLLLEESRKFDAFSIPPPNPRLRPGDQIEITGSPWSGGAVLQLSDCSWRVLGHVVPPPPEAVTLAAAKSHAHDCRAVTLKGRLVSSETIVNGVQVSRSLKLNVEGEVIEALLQSAGQDALAGLPTDHWISAAGVIEPVNSKSGGFRLQLHSPSSVCVLGPSSQFILHQALWGLVLLTVAGSIAGGWIWMLRRRVAARTDELSAANQRLRLSEQELLANLGRERELGDLKSSFVSLVSHEFRTPMAVILSSVEILKNHFDRLKPEVRRQQLDTVAQSTQQMSGLIESVMILGRVEGGRLRFDPKSVELSTFCAMVRDEVTSATHHRNPVVLTITGIGKPAQVDESLLRHILTNLLTNAVKYSPAGSAVDFRVTHEGFELVVEIGDHGIGIPEADHARVFEAFHRAGNVGNITGSGLGLIIVKRCVDLHGGEVAFKSRPGEGTTFTVRLPAFDVSTARSLPRAVPQPRRP